MTILIRAILIGLIIFLLVRSFVRYFAGMGESEQRDDQENKNTRSKKGVPREIGEYIDYEEIKKE